MRSGTKKSGTSFLRMVLAVFYLLLAVYAFGTCLLAAKSYYLSDDALVSNSVSTADLALHFDPLNNEAIQNRAQLQLLNGNIPAVIDDLRAAVKLCPSDYLRWLQLGIVYSQNDDFVSANNSFQRAIDLAPNYAKPKWKNGILWLNEKNYDVAFDYLNQAANRDTDLFPELFSLAQNTLVDDRLIDSAIRPESILSRKTAANYFIEHNINSEKAENFITGIELADDDKEGFVVRLNELKKFQLAYRVWASQKKNKLESADRGEHLLLNGGFERGIDPSNTGFGWQLNRHVSNVHVSLNNRSASRDLQSVELNFQGNSDPFVPVLSQIAVVSPNHSYRLMFAASVDNEFVSGGLPIVTLTDPVSNNLVASSTLLKSTSGRWDSFSVDFRTNTNMNAVVINIGRANCPSSPCPAFGTIGFDDFVLRSVQGVSGRVTSTNKPN